MTAVDGYRPEGGFPTPPLETLDLAELLATEPEPPAWVWHRYLERGALAMLHGDGGTGKSLIALGLARAVTRGEPFLGWPTTRGRVVYVDAENPLREIHRRLSGFDFRPDESLVYVRAHEAILGSIETASLLEDLIAADAPALVVLDSQRGLWAGDEREALEARAMLRGLRQVAERADVAILLLHHDRRTLDYSGSSDINAMVDSRLHLCRANPSSATDRKRKFVHAKSRAAEELPPVELEIRFDAARGGYVFELGDGAGPAATLPAKTVSAAAWIRGQGRARTWQIAEAVGVSERTVRRWRDDLRALGVDSDGEGLFWTADVAQVGDKKADADTTSMSGVRPETTDMQGKQADADMADIWPCPPKTPANQADMAAPSYGRDDGRPRTSAASARNGRAEGDERDALLPLETAKDGEP